MWKKCSRAHVVLLLAVVAATVVGFVAQPNTSARVVLADIKASAIVARARFGASVDTLTGRVSSLDEQRAVLLHKTERLEAELAALQQRPEPAPAAPQPITHAAAVHGTLP